MSSKHKCYKNICYCPFVKSILVMSCGHTQLIQLICRTLTWLNFLWKVHSKCSVEKYVLFHSKCLYVYSHIDIVKIHRSFLNHIKLFMKPFSKPFPGLWNTFIRDSYNSTNHVRYLHAFLPICDFVWFYTLLSKTQHHWCTIIQTVNLKSLCAIWMLLFLCHRLPDVMSTLINLFTV